MTSWTSGRRKVTRRQVRSCGDICLAPLPSPVSLGAGSLLLPCFWHLHPRKTDGFASPWIHTQSHTDTHKLSHSIANACEYCINTHIGEKGHTTKRTNNLQWRHGDFDKQIDFSGHPLMHSALGRWTAAQISPALILGLRVALQPQQQIFPLLSSPLFSLLYSSEVCPGRGWRGSAASYSGGEMQQPSSPPVFLVLLQEADADWGEKWWRGGTLPVPWGRWNVNFATWAHLLQSGAVW